MPTTLTGKPKTQEEYDSINNKPSKEVVLAYRFPGLVERIQKDLSLNEKEAFQLFQDMLMFLYLCGTNTSKLKYSPPFLIDEAWHIFILFTEEYASFCQKYFGDFIHHRPFTSKNRGVEVNMTTPVIPIAKQIFGDLSSNWENSLKCRSTCRGGECSGQSCRDND